MTCTIWHNPRCSKSRAALALLESHTDDILVRLYLNDPPSAEEIKQALDRLQIEANALLRKGEAEFKLAGLGPGSSESAVIDAMSAYPKLIERPIVFANGKARIGRPPEAILDILE